ncbi:MAG: tRNA (N(6)-L-threonylcarbamoyladenosine(37)-C(2))-methylthiotransferase MtaB [Clostridia bacterium]|nr:tRNA (N(6)-L-threonylcarbamoyladenosine(37)-C(2))-methylthiotransferase MtaB [Clostridia bacterium]
MTFYVYTLGCKVNHYESGAIAKEFEKNGAFAATDGKNCDVYIVNTCAVTEESVRKSKQAVRRAKRNNPSAVTVVCGCAPHSDINFADSLPEADIIAGNLEKSRLFELVCEHFKTGERIVEIGDISKEKKIDTLKAGRTEKTRGVLKIQDGCNNFCSYCVIPFTRGRIRSKDIESAVAEAKELVCEGCKEIVLTGIHLDNYGKETGIFDLCDLLLRLDGIEGLERVRLSSLEPVFITEETVNRLKNVKNLCRHFHLSLQSGCEKTLRAMNRHYTPEEFSKAVNLLRRTFDGCSVTTDIITGFPGETDEDFEISLEFAKKTGFSKVHVFPYSERKGTVAAAMENRVPKEIRADRCRKMIAACAEGEENYRKELIGKVKTVLFETRENGFFTGYTEEYVEVRVKTDKDIANLILPVKITDVCGSVTTGVLA